VEHPQPIINKQLNGGAIPQSIWLRTICRKNGRDVTDDQIRLLEKYAALLLEWNTKINLISRKDVDNVWLSHIVHSIVPLFKIDLYDPVDEQKWIAMRQDRFNFFRTHDEGSVRSSHILSLYTVVIIWRTLHC